MRIVFVFHDAELYGATLSALDLACAMRQRNQQCVFLLPAEGPLTSVLKQQGFEYFIADYDNWAVYKTNLYSNPYTSGNKIVRLFKLGSFILKHLNLALNLKGKLGKVDWVYSNSSLVSFGFILAKVLRVHHIWQFREFIGDGKDYQYIFSAAVRKFVYRRNYKFVFGTQALKNYYAAEIGPDKGRAIYDPVDFNTSTLPEESAKTEGKPIVFGMLGSVNKNKGQMEVLRVFARLAALHNNIALLIAGEGETEELKKFIAQNSLQGQVELRAYTDAAKFYKEVDYVVINSQFEGFGRVAVEAMKSYKPVLGKKSTGTYELLGNSERGFLFEDEKGLEDWMIKIAQGGLSTKVILQNAYLWAKKNTTPIDVADRVLEYMEPGYKPEGKENVFATIYKDNVWGEDESASGPGSTLVQTEKVREMLPVLCKEWNVKTFLDIPCGDLNWMQLVDLGPGVQYIGGDVVSNLVIANQKKFEGTNRQFKVLDLMNDKLPEVDLLFCRDCLVHFSYHDINKALANIKRSGIKYLLATTFRDRPANSDISTGNWRPLNLQAAPFNFPAPKQMVLEECTENDGIYADKCLGLWLVSDLNIPSSF